MSSPVSGCCVLPAVCAVISGVLLSSVSVPRCCSLEARCYAVSNVVPDQISFAGFDTIVVATLSSRARGEEGGIELIAMAQICAGRRRAAAVLL
jgi:hypothetical protein